MTYLLESPQMGTCRAFAWVVVTPEGPQVTLSRDAATRFESKTKARRAARNTLLSPMNFTPVKDSQ